MPLHRSLLLLVLVICGCTSQTDPYKTEVSVKTRYFNTVAMVEDGTDQIDERELTRQGNKYPKRVLLESASFAKTVALTFDDGPSLYSESIAQVLDQHNIKGTFFWTGKRIQKDAEVGRSLISRGHNIGNHTLLHQHNRERDAQEFWQLSVEPTNQLIETHLGISTSLFRPSYGEISDAQIELLARKGMTTILWSVDTRDWNDDTANATVIAAAANDFSHPGAIILMHDAGGNRQPTVDALPAIIKHYQQQGYRFVTIEQMLAERR